jgi:uncharacterized LabA/DUF88 family protein
MDTATLTQTDRDFLELIRSTDERGKELLLDALICIVAFGDSFLDAFDAAVKLGREEAEKTLGEWKKRLIP